MLAGAGTSEFANGGEASAAVGRTGAAAVGGGGGGAGRTPIGGGGGGTTRAPAGGGGGFGAGFGSPLTASARNANTASLHDGAADEGGDARHVAGSATRRTCRGTASTVVSGVVHARSAAYSATVATAKTANPNLEPKKPDELEELADADLEELEPTLQMPRERTSSERASAPPPLPIEARRSSVPPSPPQSGMFRIKGAQPRTEQASVDPAELAQQVQQLQAELHERTTQVDRMRLAVTLRDDRLHELERALGRQRDRAGELERSLDEQRARVRALEQALREREAASHDDLRRIPGIGPVFARKLAERGVTRFEQLASMGAAEIAELADALGVPVRRIEGAGWVSKAAALVAQKSPATVAC